MRVAYVTMAFPTPYETFAASDVRALRRAGVDVTVFSLRPPHPECAALVEQWGLGSVAISHNTLASSFAGFGYSVRHPIRSTALALQITQRMWRSPRFLVRMLALVPRCLDILRIVERDRPDVVHLFWGHYPAAVGLAVRRYCPHTVLSMFLGAYDLEWNFGVSAPLARSADVVWTHAEANVTAIAALGVRRDRIGVAHRGVELDRFVGRRRRKVPGRIVTAGRLHSSKGMGRVVEAFADVVRQYPDASLVVVGDGPDRPEFEQLATRLGVANAVSFLGRVSHEAVLEQLAQAELFVYLSVDVTDRLPNVVKEAVASRCVCVVSRTTGIEELIRDGVDGWVVERGNVEEARARVCDAFADRERSAAMVASAYERLRAEFDVDRSMRRHVERWTSLLELAPDAEPPEHREPFALGGKPGVGRTVLR